MGKKQWTADVNTHLIQQIKLLEQIKMSNQQKNWKMISKILGKKGYKRSEQECRHKWVNCLSPQINHGPWTDEELATLYGEYEKNLSRWSVIQKFLPHRTQIKIKNHFYGVLRNTIRFILKYFQRIPGKQTETSNKVNPNTLKSIYWGEGEFSYLQHQIQNLIVCMKHRFNKQKLLKIVSEKEKLYEKLNDKILQEVKISVKVPLESQAKRKPKKNIEVKEENISQDEDEQIVESVVAKQEALPPSNPQIQSGSPFLNPPPANYQNMGMNPLPMCTFFYCYPTQPYGYMNYSVTNLGR